MSDPEPPDPLVAAQLLLAAGRVAEGTALLSSIAVGPVPSAHVVLAAGLAATGDERRAWRELRFGAERGDAEAAWRLSRRGDADAVAWEDEAAARGHPAAALNRGSRAAGDGRLEEARAWFRRAAEAGHPVAALRLAGMLAEGLGGPVDQEEAERLVAPLVAPKPRRPRARDRR